MTDYRQSQSSKQNPEALSPLSPQAPPELPKPEDIVDPASPAAERNRGGIRLFSQLRQVSATERRYRLRRVGIIAFGFFIIVLVMLASFSIRSLFVTSTGSSAREFSGPFLIRAEASSDLSPFPGGAPMLRVSAVPAAGDSPDKPYPEITVFQTTLLEPDRISDLYAEFVSRQIAFIFIDTLFAVTTNGGHSWKVVTLYEEPIYEKSAVWIDGVMLDETGHGFLFPEGIESLDSAWLSEDFGHSWHAPE